MLIGKDLFCAKIHNEYVQCLCCLCSIEHTAGFQKLWYPAIPEGEHGVSFENMEDTENKGKMESINQMT